MYLIRETMHCKPGKVRPLVEKFKKMADLMEKLSMGRPRIMTDLAGAPYWTVISEFEVESLEAHLNMDDKAFADAGGMEIMSGYHELVDSGRREIFKIEA